MGGTRNPTTGVWTGEASLSFVTVGDPGNAPDTVVMGDGTTGYGSVPYVYQMGQYDVTVGQYVQFLNAVAKTDTFGLYNRFMGPYESFNTIGITQSGSSGSYTYSVAGSDPQAANCPICDATWGDAARFANWLQNGQPTGAEGPGTTETGAYTLDGDTGNLRTEARNAGATYFIPSENELYKAAYYKSGGTNAGYWLYSTQSNTVPSNMLSATGTNNTNFVTGSYPNYNYTDPTNYLTPVGAFSASPGPYGTYDQGGDVWQWDEAVMGSSRGMLGGSWENDSVASSGRGESYPLNEFSNIGFRVAAAYVPEPSAITLFSCLCRLLLGYVWRRRKTGNRALVVVALASVLTIAAGISQAQGVFNMPSGQTSLSFVTVGNPGNVADTFADSDVPGGCGAVGYVYQMGKYDVTVGQYCQFLKAVAATDTYGLYNSGMAVGGLYGNYPTIGITQSGSSGNTTTRSRVATRRPPTAQSSAKHGAMPHGSAIGYRTASPLGPKVRERRRVGRTRSTVLSPMPR